MPTFLTAAGGGPPKILLVEDDLSVHFAISRVLAGEGYEVVHAFDGIDAIQRHLSTPDLGAVLLDLNLPHRRGWDVFEPITRARPDVPVIVITAEPNQRSVADAAGAAALLEKPLEIPLLLETIERVRREQPGDRIERLAGCAPLAHFTPTRR